MAAFSLFTMVRVLFLCFCFMPFAASVEEVVVAHAPECIKFLSSDLIHSRYLADIFSSMFAYTIQNPIGWRGLASVLPWKRPEAIVIVEIQGFNNKVDIPIDGTKFLLENVGDIDTQCDLLSLRTQERFPSERPVLLRMDLGGELSDSKVVQPSLFKSIPADPQKRLIKALANLKMRELIEESTFNVSVPSEAQLLTELVTVKEFLKALKSHKSEVQDNVNDIYWLRIGGLIPIIENYGTNSLQFQEAERLIRQIILEIKATMRTVYDDNVVIAVMKVDDLPTASFNPFNFHNRRLLQEAPSTTPSTTIDYNLAPKWSPEFPIIFMMVLFIVLTLFISILGVSVGMWNMDPGKDSIIYRATQRMKKD